MTSPPRSWARTHRLASRATAEKAGCCCWSLWEEKGRGSEAQALGPKDRLSFFFDLYKIPFPLTSGSRATFLFFCLFHYSGLHGHKETVSLYSKIQFPCFFSESS